MKTLRRHLLMLLFATGAFLPVSLLAQTGTDSTSLSDETLEKVIEDAMTDLEGEDQADWTIVTDYLQDLLRKPLDLNNATPEQLTALPGVTPMMADALNAYIKEYGELTGVYELQAVPGFTPEICSRIKPYITVSGAGIKDLGRGQMHPAGPSLKTVFREANHEVLLRFITILEEQKGFTPPDTNSDGSLTSRYEGSAPRMYTRYRMRYGQNFSLALLGEKDSGEPFRWDPERKFYGYDFVSGHISMQDYGSLKKLVVGDFTLQVGQGLALSTGLGYGKGGDVIMSIKRQNYGVRPYASVNENQFLRGAATTIAVKRFYFTGFFSRVSLDANLLEADTLNDDLDGANVSTIQTGGYHRTESEIADKASLLETMMGGRAEFRSRKLTIATTNYYQVFGREIAPTGGTYQQFYFSGKSNYLNAVDFDFTRRNFNLFGEVARSASGGIGMVTGVLASLDPKLDVSIYFRSVDRDFHSTRGFIFAESPTQLSNEKGVYFGVKIKPIPKWSLSLFMDQFWFPWEKYQVSFPSRGYEYLAQLQYTPSKTINVYLRWRSDNKQYNESDVAPEQKLEYLVPVSNNHLRLHFETKISRTLSIESRIEQSWYKRGSEEVQKGILIYQDISWKLAWKWKITGRYAIFDAPDWDARIYAYENDVPGFFNIPAYTGTGSRYYAILQFNPTRDISLWVRYSRTNLPNEKTISSGLSEIQGSNRSELKVQARIEF